MATLETAIILAAEVHKNQKDKAGTPYILHPLRVMMKMDSDVEKVIAVLHDVMEDTWVSESDLEDLGFSNEIIKALTRLTKFGHETYWWYISRLINNPLALKVKLAELEDNMDLKRIENPTEKDFKRLRRYRYYWDILGGKKLPENDEKRTYSVFIENNANYSNEDERYRLETYDDCQTALDFCRRKVDNFLIRHFKKGQTARELYDDYTTFGDNLSIVSNKSPQDCTFKAWEYAEERAKEIVKAYEKRLGDDDDES